MSAEITLLKDIAALSIEAENPAFDPADGRVRFAGIQTCALALFGDHHRIAVLGRWKPIEPQPAGFSVAMSSTGVHGSRDDERYLLREWCGKLDAAIRQLLDAEAAKAKPPSRPRGTGYEVADAPLVERMRPLVAGGMSPTQAAWKVIGRDGKGASGDGTPDSKAKRLVRRYRAQHGE